jgi:polar amino acid transport system permease protein
VDYVFQFGPVLREWPMLLDGAWLTVQLVAVSIVLGFVLGLGGAVGRVYGPAWLNHVIGIYVEAIRNTPLLVQLFIVYFGLPGLGLRTSANTAAIIGLTVNLGAYATEIIRAGIEGGRRGESEAGLALGLRRMQVVRLIVLPPALQSVWPALTSQFILLALASSIASAISAEELTSVSNLVQSRTFRSFETVIVVTGMYIVLAVLLRGMLRGLGLLLFPGLRLRGGRG